MRSKITAVSTLLAVMTIAPITSAGTLDSETRLRNADEVRRNDQDVPFAAMIIPHQNVDENGERTGTLELRLENEVCRGVTHLVDLASKCQGVSSAPLQPK